MDFIEHSPLFWAGSNIELLFTGDALSLTLEADYPDWEPWIAVELNGAPILRTSLNHGKNELCVFRNMVGGTPKHVRLFKETQPFADERNHRVELIAVNGSGGEFLLLPKRDYHLEFIGDSLTSGEGVIGAREETIWTCALFSASRTWARMTADLVNASFCAVSQSGWGVRYGWNGDPERNLPDYYRRMKALRSQEPDAIIINLGTNDASALRLLQSPEIPERVEAAAISFLQELREEHPRAKLAWAYGMTGELLRPQLEAAVERFGDAWYLPLPPVDRETMGSRQHPGPICHQMAAQAAADFLKIILHEGDVHDGKQTDLQLS